MTLEFILYEGSKAAKSIEIPIDRIYTQVEKSVYPPPERWKNCLSTCDITLLPSNSVAL